jgi:hypothetical protein
MIIAASFLLINFLAPQNPGAVTGSTITVEAK